MMRNKDSAIIRNIFLVLLLLIGLAGCAQYKITAKQVDWVPVSGSRADAIVKLSYAYNPLVETPIVNEEQAIELAKKRCNSWGYPDVEAFGGSAEGCNRSFWDGLQHICTSRYVIRNFQCIGRGDAAVPTDNAIEKK